MNSEHEIGTEMKLNDVQVLDPLQKAQLDGAEELMGNVHPYYALATDLEGIGAAKKDDFAYEMNYSVKHQEMNNSENYGYTHNQ